MRKIGIERANPRKKPIPPSASLAAAADFWERHDSTEYFSGEDLVPLRTWTKGKKVRHVYVAPDGRQYELIALSNRPRRKIPA